MPIPMNPPYRDPEWLPASQVDCYQAGWQAAREAARSTGPAEGEALRRLTDRFDEALDRCALYGNADQVRDNWYHLKVAIYVMLNRAISPPALPLLPRECNCVRHVFDIGEPTCACRTFTVALAALAPLSGPKKEHDDEDDSRVGRQCAVGRCPTAKEPRLRAVGR